MHKVNRKVKSEISHRRRSLRRSNNHLLFFASRKLRLAFHDE